MHFWGAFDARIFRTFAIARDILNAQFLLFGMTFAPQELPLCLHNYQSFYHNCVQNSIVFAQLVYLTTPNAVFCGKIWENVYLLWQTCTLLGKIVYLRKLLQLSKKEKIYPIWVDFVEKLYSTKFAKRFWMLPK